MANEERYFHARVYGKQKAYTLTSVEINLTKEQIIWDFIHRINTGKMVVCDGNVYVGNEITTFKFYSSKQKLQLPKDHTRYDLPHFVYMNLTDVTRELLEESKEILPKEEPSAFSNEVFIVHGHSTSEHEFTRMLENELHLKAIILHEQPNGGKTIIEKLEREAEKPAYVFVLLSPDDIGSEDKHPTIGLNEQDLTKYEFKHRGSSKRNPRTRVFYGKVR